VWRDASMRSFELLTQSARSGIIARMCILMQAKFDAAMAQKKLLEDDATATQARCPLLYVYPQCCSLSMMQQMLMGHQKSVSYVPHRRSVLFRDAWTRPTHCLVLWRARRSAGLGSLVSLTTPYSG